MHSLNLVFCFAILAVVQSCQTPADTKVLLNDTASVVKLQTTAVNREDTAFIIQQVRTDYQRINNAKLINKAFHWQSPDSCQPPYMEGTVTYFYENNKPVKIYNEGGEDHGEWKEEYYFNNGELIFLYQNNAYGGATNPTYYKYQNRYYFNAGRLIKKIESPQERMPEEEDIQRAIKLAQRLLIATDQAAVARAMACVE